MQVNFRYHSQRHLEPFLQIEKDLFLVETKEHQIKKMCWLEKSGLSLVRLKDKLFYPFQFWLQVVRWLSKNI